ncbi:MAG TPA: DNA primase DnaG [Candidatus Bathyarchaeia archaeon]|nr:DNA primase DnaG [Candidatus Bathyarchaeia archaeon]
MTENDEKFNDSSDEQTTTKYLIYADFTIDGLVEKPDVVGALFGQTEGLLSDDLDLRELQKSGRVGRIQVNLTLRGGKTRGALKIPSSLDKVETSILAAAIETVDRIGPCSAQISIKRIEDIRKEKMKKIRARASELLQKWNSEATQESSELADEVSKAARTTGISTFGRLPAGPEFGESDTIIIVEGRADIAACLRAGVRNTIAVQGASVPKTIVELTKKRTTIAFLDGDRGGDLILKELLMYSSIDYIARAPIGKEVEDLKPDEIIDQLSKKVPIEKLTFISEIHADEILQKAIQRKASKTLAISQPIVQDETKTPVKVEEPKGKVEAFTPHPPPRQQTGKPPQYQKDFHKPESQSSDQKPQYRERDSREYRDSRGPRRGPSSSRDRYQDNVQRGPPPIPEELVPMVKEIDGKEKQEGIFLDEKLKEVKRVPVATIYEEIKNSKDVTKVIFDGIITQRLIDVCEEKNINTIIGAKTAELERRPAKVRYYIFAY